MAHMQELSLVVVDLPFLLAVPAATADGTETP
jgi:hypothetical protein